MGGRRERLGAGIEKQPAGETGSEGCVAAGGGRTDGPSGEEVKSVPFQKSRGNLTLWCWVKQESARSGVGTLVRQQTRNRMGELEAWEMKNRDVVGRRQMKLRKWWRRWYGSNKVRRGEDREHNKVAGEEWESGGGGEGEQWGRGGKGDLTFMEVEVQGTLEGLWYRGAGHCVHCDQGMVCGPQDV